MRAYFWTNMYLSSIQHGIQAQHCTAEMFRKYKEPSQQFDKLANWADLHKTTIIKNGGDEMDMVDVQALILSEDNPYPWAEFYEAGVGNALTCVGVILPEGVYDFAAEMHKIRNGGEVKIPEELTSWEFDMSELINSTGLAR